jgi:hypothetical protein
MAKWGSTRFKGGGVIGARHERVAVTHRAEPVLSGLDTDFRHWGDVDKHE